MRERENHHWEHHINIYSAHNTPQILKRAGTGLRKNPVDSTVSEQSEFCAHIFFSFFVIFFFFFSYTHIFEVGFSHLPLHHARWVKGHLPRSSHRNNFSLYVADSTW